MATNLLAPMGLVFSRNRRIGANTYQANQYTIKAGMTQSIGIGDVVNTSAIVTNPPTSAAGYIQLAPDGTPVTLGVFAAVLPYYDKTLQATGYGLNGSYTSNANPGADINCLVIDDPDAVFRAQVSGGPWAQSWRGKNIDWVTTTNGAPNASGISTLALDATTVSTSSTLPFRIIGLVGVAGGPQDPNNTNPWVEVVLNTSENLSSGGI